MDNIKTIFVSKEPTSDKLKLRDSEGHNPGNDKLTTLVDAGDTIRWELDGTDSGLSEIFKIEKKSDTHNILKAAPEPVDGYWQAIVKDPSPGKGKTEKYKIGYKIKDRGEKHWDDPKLQMNN